ncbi:hypothetical protein [uncultured Tistrella sp.]|uniref:hypothetical protein n=1 Tax=Tistrella mobilis TaxID=171437 RepID=UPI000C0A4D4A|nr:hypothetical protein [uncultured Tistrella sp.]MAM74750.1 hypothetical protein [Tistrella sp.]
MSDIFEPTRLGWLQSVQRSRETDVYGLALAASLSVLAGDDHVVRASLRELAETARISPKTAGDRLQRLAEDGLLTLVDTGATGGHQPRRFYRLAMAGVVPGSRGHDARGAAAIPAAMAAPKPTALAADPAPIVDPMIRLVSRIQQAAAAPGWKRVKAAAAVAAAVEAAGRAAVEDFADQLGAGPKRPAYDIAVALSQLAATAPAATGDAGQRDDDARHETGAAPEDRRSGDGRSDDGQTPPPAPPLPAAYRAEAESLVVLAGLDPARRRTLDALVTASGRAAPCWGLRDMTVTAIGRALAEADHGHIVIPPSVADLRHDLRPRPACQTTLAPIGLTRNRTLPSRPYPDSDSEPGLMRMAGRLAGTSGGEMVGQRVTG